MNGRWKIVVGVFAALVLIVGIIHLAFRASAQLYLNIRETNEKQTKHIFALEKKVAEIDQKLALLEQSMKYEAQKKQ